LHHRSKHYKTTSVHPYSSNAFQQYQEQGGVPWFERSQHDKQKQTNFPTIHAISIRLGQKRWWTQKFYLAGNCHMHPLCQNTVGTGKYWIFWFMLCSHQVPTAFPSSFQPVWNMFPNMFQQYFVPFCFAECCTPTHIGGAILGQNCFYFLIE